MNDIELAENDQSLESEQRQWMSFVIADTSYCTPLDSINEIFTFLAPTPVPGASQIIDGILNIRGQIATVFSGRKLFSQPDVEPTSSSRIIILNIEDELVGFIVDEVKEVIHFCDSKVDMNQVTATDSLTEGSVFHNGELFSVLDFSSLTKHF